MEAFCLLTQDLGAKGSSECRRLRDDEGPVSSGIEVSKWSRVAKLLRMKSPNGPYNLRHGLSQRLFLCLGFFSRKRYIYISRTKKRHYHWNHGLIVGWPNFIIKNISIFSPEFPISTKITN